MKQEIGTIDIVVLAVYFLLVVVCSIVSSLRTNRGTVSGYFLASRLITWLPVGASLFASNIGAEHFLGLSGSGAASGIGVGAFEINALIVLQILGWVFLPVYIASGVCTLPEYMSKRFGGQRIRVFLALLSLILYVLTKVSVNIFSGAVFIQQALGFNVYYGILLILLVTAVCTILGGLTTVIYTETFQCFLMLFGAGGLAIYSFVLVGGYTGLMNKYPHAISNDTLARYYASNQTAGDRSTCGLPNDHAFKMLRAPSDPDLPWPGFFLGQTPASIWYWSADQMMVQRVLASKSLSHAQGATIFAGYLKILPLFLIVMPGMISRVLYPNEVACSTSEQCMAVCGSPTSCYNIAYPKLVIDLLPDGARGIMLAGMLAALMSDLMSIFNSSATLITVDLWKRIRQNATQLEMMIVGRFWILIMVGLSILWVPVITEMQGGQLYLYIQSVAAYISPPIAAVYLMSILVPRTNEKGAFAGLIVGFLVGITRLILDFVYREVPCGVEDTRPALIRNFHYMYFAILLFWLSIATCCVVSVLTKPLPAFRIIRTTYWTRFDQTVRPDESATAAGMDSPKFTQPSETDELKLRKLSSTSDKLADEQMSDAGIARRFILKACGWFCLDTETSPAAKRKNEEHLRNITTLHQSIPEKVILSINLVVILSVAIFLFVFFSA